MYIKHSITKPKKGRNKSFSKTEVRAQNLKINNKILYASLNLPIPQPF